MAQAHGAGIEAADICRAFGLDPNAVAALDLHIEAGEFVTLNASLYVFDEALREFIKHVRRYEVELRELPDPVDLFSEDEGLDEFDGLLHDHEDRIDWALREFDRALGGPGIATRFEHLVFERLAARTEVGFERIRRKWFPTELERDAGAFGAVAEHMRRSLRAVLTPVGGDGASSAGVLVSRAGGDAGDFILGESPWPR